MLALTDHLVELRLTMKKLTAKAKRCDCEEAAARDRVKKSYKANNIEAARIHAEKAVRCRNESRHFQVLSARIAPLVDQLQRELSAGVQMTNFDLNSIEELLKTTNSSADKDLNGQLETNVSSTDVDTLMQQLNDEVAVELNNRLPSIEATNQFDLEQRLSKLRR